MPACRPTQNSSLVWSTNQSCHQRGEKGETCFGIFLLVVLYCSQIQQKVTKRCLAKQWEKIIEKSVFANLNLSPTHTLKKQPHLSCLFQELVTISDILWKYILFIKSKGDIIFFQGFLAFFSGQNPSTVVVTLFFFIVSGWRIGNSYFSKKTHIFYLRYPSCSFLYCNVRSISFLSLIATKANLDWQGESHWQVWVQSRPSQRFCQPTVWQYANICKFGDTGWTPAESDHPHSGCALPPM